MSVGRVIFLLSPANCAGKRARLLLRGSSRAALAHQLRSEEGATLGELFTFMSSLYFRGKLTYASAFANPPDGCDGGIHVIVPGRGLCPPGARIDLVGLQAIARVPVDPDDGRYRAPLCRDATLLAERLHPEDVAVLLGSIATPKYLPALRETLGSHLRVPQEFIGRGDMSRGALMLRCVRERRELTYVAPSPQEG